MGRRCERWKGLRAQKQGNLLHHHLLPLLISPERASHRTHSLCAHQSKGDTLTFSSLLIFPTQPYTKCFKVTALQLLSDASVNPVSPMGVKRSTYGLVWPITLLQIKLHQLIMSGDNECVTWCIIFLVTLFFFFMHWQNKQCHYAKNDR